MNSIPFCILERPFMIWGYDLASDNARFLERVDADLYYRTAHKLILQKNIEEGEVETEPREGNADEQGRKDISTLSRLLWHHGIETLVMMIGSYIQAPSAAHAYLLKCKTEDAHEMARCLLEERRPKYHRLNDAPFTLLNLLNSIHLSAGWADSETIIDRFERALRNMLRDYANDEHRWEYNSIKHGLRASHGHFGIAFGIEDVPGTPAPPDAMEMIGFSQDASFFDIAKPLRNASKQESKINFQTDKISVTWSLDRVICELQIISLLLHNVVSALRIAGGTPGNSVTFTNVSDGKAFWDLHFKLHESDVPTLSMSFDIDGREMALATDKQIFGSYRR